MRLIDAEKLRIQEFTGDPPPYAILSHRWGDDAEEVAYHEFHLPGVKSRPGYAKIENSCTQAKSDGLRYVVSMTLHSSEVELLRERASS